MKLERQVLSFLELEVFAAELYKQHRKHVPERLQPLMRQFEIVEEKHAARFRRLYEEITQRRSPRCFMATWAARIIAYVLAPLGWKTILRFECWVEERAIMDYQKALIWVSQPDVKKAILETLKDEEVHEPYMKTLKHFCRDEEMHIREMQARLTSQKI